MLVNLAWLLLWVALRAGLAATLLAALSLIGYALLPARLRPACTAHGPFVDLSVGAAAVGFAGWILGHLGITVAFAALLALALWSLACWRPWWRGVRRSARQLALLAAAHKAAAALFVFPLALLIPALLLPVSDSDGLRYHLALPKLYLLTGAISYYPWDFTAAFPQAGEVLYLIGLRLGGGETAKFIHLGFFLASLTLLALVLHRDRSSRLVALLAPLLFAVSPVALSPAAHSFVDHIALFHVGVATLLVSRRGHPATIGLALGAALATKLTAAPAIAFLALAAAAAPVTWPRRARALALVTLPVLVLILPLAARNLIKTGDPFYPLGYGLLEKLAPGAAPAAVKRYIDYTASYNARAAGSGMSLPWVYVPGRGTIDDVVGPHHLVGLFALVLALRRRETRPILLVIFPYLAMLLVTTPPARYLLPMLWGLAAFEAEAVALARRWAVGLVALVGLPALLTSAHSLLTMFRPLELVRHDFDTTAYLDARLPGYRLAGEVNALPAGGKVMALDFPCPYYFARPWIVEGQDNDPPLRTWLDQGDNDDELVARLRALDVRYLVVTAGYGGGREASLVALARSEAQARTLAALRSRLTLVRRDHDADIYDVPR